MALVVATVRPRGWDEGGGGGGGGGGNNDDDDDDGSLAAYRRVQSGWSPPGPATSSIAV